MVFSHPHRRGFRGWASVECPIIASWGCLGCDGAILRPELASCAAKSMAVDFRRGRTLWPPSHSHHRSHCHLARCRLSERRLCNPRIMEYCLCVVGGSLVEEYGTAHGRS